MGDRQVSSNSDPYCLLSWHSNSQYSIIGSGDDDRMVQLGEIARMG